MNEEEIETKRYTRGNSRTEVIDACKRLDVVAPALLAALTSLSFDRDVVDLNRRLHAGRHQNSSSDTSSTGSLLTSAPNSSFSSINLDSSSVSSLGVQLGPYNTPNHSQLNVSLSSTTLAALSLPNSQTITSHIISSQTVASNSSKTNSKVNVEDVRKLFGSHSSAIVHFFDFFNEDKVCLLYTSPSPRD